VSKRADNRAPEPSSSKREERKPLPTWRNTRPRDNPALDRRDLARSIERFETVLGR